MSQQVEPRASAFRRVLTRANPALVLDRLATSRWERWLAGATLLVLIALAGARPAALSEVGQGVTILGLAARAQAVQTKHPAQAAGLWRRIRAYRAGDLAFQERAAAELFRLYGAAQAQTELTALLSEPAVREMLQRGAPRLASAVGLALLRSGATEAAIDVLRPALERAATPARHRVLALRLAAALTQAGRAAEAEPLLLGLYESEPDDPDLRNALAYHYALTDARLDEAERLLRPVLRAHPWRLSERLLAAREHRLAAAEYLDTMAWIRYRQDRLDAAKELLLAAVDNSADQPQAEILYHLAQVCYDLGDDRQAWDYCAKALALQPQHPEALRLQGLLEGADQNEIG